MGNEECPYTGCTLSETKTLMYYKCKAYYFNTKPILCMLLRLLRLLTKNAAFYPLVVHNVNQLKLVLEAGL